MTASPSSDHADPQEMQEHVRVYLLVFAALAVLTVTTTVVGYLDLSSIPALIAAVGIASVKAGLVAGYFMHLISEEKVIYLLLGFTVVFLLGMIILTTASYYDNLGFIVVA